MKKRLKHCRKPHGKLGKEVLEDMNDHHSELTTWGLKHLSICSNYKILDVGCGGGYTISQLALKIEDGTVYGIDYSDLSVKYSKEFCKELRKNNKVHIKKASVSNLPFQDNKFDFVTAVETFYFWPDKVNDLKEILRVLKPNGTLALINEMYISKEKREYEERNQKWAEAGEFEIYTVEQMMKFLEKAGYKDIRVFEENHHGWITILGKK
ncbi:MAG: class I SAM-dependent methyltransferase [Candidatus Lokiarchaeota archaeon]